ncbi:MAG: Calx-beta domain-containing protein, partial [bacterium]
ILKSTGVGTITNDDSAILSITGFTVSEGDAPGSNKFTITMDKAVQTPFTIDFATSDNTATAGTDYTAVATTTLTFGGANALSQTVTVPIINDVYSEPTETLYGTISNKVAAAAQSVTFIGNGSSAQATGTITDNDQAYISINNVTNSEPDLGSTVAYVFTVTHSGGSTDGPFTVAYTTTDVTTTATSDYVPQTGTLTFSGTSGETHTITIVVNGDNIVEPTETFTVNLSEGSFGGRIISFTQAVGTGTITDNEATQVSITASTPSASEPSTNGQFTVSMPLVSSTSTVILYSVSGTATAGSDYTALSGTVTIPAGSTSATISVPVINDNIVESTETVIVTLTSISSGDPQISIGAPNIATVNIADDDAATVSITATVAAAGEPSTNGQFTVTMTKASDVPTVISYTVGGTATAGTDYTALSGTLTIAALSTTATIDVPVIDDLVLEATETVIVTLGTITSGDPQVTLSATVSATVNITDNDAATVSIAANDPNAAEPSNGGQFTVTMTHPADVATVIAYSVTGTATSGTDYIALSGSVTIPAGSTTATIDVNVNDDLIVEASETVIATLTGIISGDANTTLGTPVAATVTIADNDAASLSIADVAVGESDGTATFTVLLTGAVQGGFTIAYATANGTALQPGDYTLTSGTLTFTGTNAETHTISVPIINNSVVEITETFVVNLSSISNALVTYDSQATGTITDDDVATVSIGNVTHNEGNSSTTSYTFTVTMSKASDAAVTVDYATTDATATTADADYTLQTGTLTFSAGTTTQTLTVLVTGDTKVESTETFTVGLSNLATISRPITLGTSTGTGTITNDDAATVSIGNATVAEGNAGTTNFTFTATLSAASAVPVFVDYATANGTATVVDGDYLATNGTMVFSPGQTTQTVIVSVSGDTKVELSETFTLNLSNISASGYSVTLGTSTGTGTITNDDAATISIGDVTLAEGNSGTTSFGFTVSMTYASDAAVSVVYATSDGTATTADADYSAVSTTTLTFAIGETSKTVTVAVNGDTKFEGNETFTVGLTSLSNNGRAVTLSDVTGLGTITNDDNAPPVAVDDHVTTPEDTPVSGSVTANDTDAEGDPLTVTQYAVSGSTYSAGITATLASVGSLLINPNGSFMFTPVTNYNGTVPTASYVITDGNGGSDTGDLMITVTAVNDPPVIVNETLSFCSNAAMTGNVLANGDYDPDGTALTVNTTPVTGPSHGTLSVSANGAFTYTLTDATYNGTDQATVSVCDNGTPTPSACTNDVIFITVFKYLASSAGPDQSLCNVTGTTLAANDPTPCTGLWTMVSGPNSPAITDPSLYNTTVTSMVPGIYQFKWAITNGVCPPSESTVTITNSATPTTATVGATQNVCGTLTSGSLGGNTPVNGNGTWSQVSGPGGSMFSAQTSGSSTATANAYGAYVYKWAITNGSCTASTASISVNYYETPTTATVGSTQNICGSLVSAGLGGNTPTVGTGAWSIVSGGTGTFSASTSGSSTFTASSYGTYVLRWTISNGTCTPGTADLTVNFSQSITANGGANQSLCNAGYTMLIGNTPASGSSAWALVSGPNSPAIFPSTGSMAIVTGLIASQTNYVFSYTITNGTCISSSTMTLTNYNQPTAAFAGNDQVICHALPATATMAANSPASGFGSGLWTQESGPSATITANTSNATTITGLSAGTYVFRWTISNGPCQSSSDLVTLLVGTPATVDAGNAQTICEGATATMSATASGYTSLLWTSSGTGTFSSNSVLNPVYTPSASDIVNGSAILTLTASQGGACPATAGQMTLTINKAPLAAAGSNASVCQGTAFTVSTASASNYLTLSWAANAGATGALTNTTGLTPTYTPLSGETGVVTLTLTASPNSGCSTAATSAMTITIMGAPTSAAGDDATICSGSTYPMAATAVNGSSLLWSTPGDGYFNNNATEDPIYTPGVADKANGHVHLTLTVYGNTPCTPATDEMILTISPALSVTTQPASGTICSGSAHAMSVSVSGGSGTFTYQWQQNT